MKVGIITVSDKGSKGERKDISGQTIRDFISAHLRRAKMTGCSFEYALIPDELRQISARLIEFADKKKCALIFTTGGTGFTDRDVTPEATLKVIEKNVPGIPEAMRMKSLAITPFAMLSRAIAGIRGKSLIINLPGSPKAVTECLEVIQPVLGHAMELLDKGSMECANGRVPHGGTRIIHA